MHTIIQGILLGILTGGVYALMASGQTLIFGIMKVVNLAQGAMVILSAYLSYSLFTSLGVDPFLSVLITTPALFCLGVAAQWLFLRQLRREDVAELSILVTFAIALAVEGALSVFYSTTYKSVNASYANSSFTVAGYHISAVRLYAFLLSAAVIGLLYLLLHRTRFGRAVRATVQNPEAAQLLGVNPGRIRALGFGLGTATAAAAGSVFGLIYPFNSGSHYDLISQLLSVVVLGGLGSLGGAIVAGVLIGVASSVVSVAWSPTWSQFTFFVVLLAVLLVRPRGLFGTVMRGAI
ncbi:MAG: branched-chain amino acid transport system permease protein [Streptosporangiaceae bacterium]|nr:amino acid/amide transporter rane protein 1, family [Streptosporangiaceae bacterium]MDX6432586.1 branched-chain amino acid transport system permease protein [Streptosporangiaceae bacterium]